MSESTTPATVVTYGTFSFDVATLPQASLIALVSSGLTHKLGNECNSKVSTARKKAKEAGQPDLTDDEAAKVLADAQADMAKRIADGTIGTIVRGPKLSPIEKLMREIAVERITARLTAAGLKVPSGKETVKAGADEFTLAQLIERRFAAEGDAIRREAETKLKAREREIEKLRKQAEGAEATSAEALGL